MVAHNHNFTTRNVFAHIHTIKKTVTSPKTYKMHLTNKTPKTNELNKIKHICGKISEMV